MRGQDAIGVDSNQNMLEPGHVVTSCLKNVGDAIYAVYRTIADDTYEPGVVLEYGVAEGGMGLAIDDTGHPSGQVSERLIEIQDGLAEGKITVKRYL